MNKYLVILYVSICTLGPIMKNYVSPLGRAVTLLDFLILLFYLLSFFSFSEGRRKKINLPCAILFLFIISHSIICLLMWDEFSVFLRALRVANYIFFVAFYNGKFFNVGIAQKQIRFIGVAATLFLVLQHVSSLFLGISIPGYIEQFYMLEEDRVHTIAGTEISRYSSFFVEPSGYASYMSCVLVHELFYIGKPNMKLVALFSLGAILSTSNTAIAISGFIYALYLYKNKLFNTKTLILFFSFVVIAVVAQPYLEVFSMRVEEGRSMSGRFNGYEYVDSLLKNPLWGMGFISPENMGIYLAGYARLLVYFGYIGVLIYTIFSLSVLKSTQKKELLFVFLLLNLGACPFLSPGFIYFMSFIVASNTVNINNHIDLYKRQPNASLQKVSELMTEKRVKKILDFIKQKNGEGSK